MPTNKPRVTFTLSQEKLDEIDSYRFENKIKNQTQAILSLISKGMADYLAERKEAPSLSDEALKLAQDYETAMDAWGQKQVRSVADIEIARVKAEEAKRAEKAKKQVCMEAAEEIEPVTTYNVPHYSLPMSAGTGEEAGQEYPDDFILTKRPPRGTSYIAEVSGSSMEPTYHDGDLIFVYAATEIRTGQVGVFYMGGKQWIKELGDGVLISHNPTYDPIPIREDIRCQGLVLGVCDERYFES